LRNWQERHHGAIPLTVFSALRFSVAFMELPLFDILTGAILTLFFVVFLLVYFLNRTLKAAGWVSLCFLGGIIAQVIDKNRSVFEPYYIDELAIPIYWASFVSVITAYASRVNVQVNRRAISVIIGFGILVLAATFRNPEYVALRSILMDCVGGAILLTGTPILLRRRSNLIENILFWYNSIAVAICYARTAILIFDIAPSGFATSSDFYEVVFYMTSAIAAMAGANIIFIVMGVDTLSRLQREAMIDPLTGLYNRRGMSMVVNRAESKDAIDSTLGRAVMLFDIDHFKRINDEFGHEAGDAVLAKIGTTTTQLMEYHGHVARTGGEEFLMLFNAESSPVARVIAEHLRVAIGLLVHEDLPPDMRITASFGIAYVREGETFKRTVRRSDAALYVAKDNGRNRVCLAEGDEMPKELRAMG
jgi:diguanylate cyclase (GGDEF)-like protein